MEAPIQAEHGITSTYPAEINLTSTERLSSYEFAQQAIAEFLKPVIELEELGIFDKDPYQNTRTRVSVVFHGSAVTESKAPGDLDIIIIYPEFDWQVDDEIIDNITSTLSTDAKNLYTILNDGFGKKDLEGRTHIHKSIADTRTLDTINYRFMTEESFIEAANATPNMQKRLIENNIAALASTTEDTNVQYLLENWGNFVNKTLPIEERQKYLEKTKTLGKVPTPITDDNIDYITWINDSIATKLSPEVSKSFRSSTLSHKLGINWIQAGIENGAVLIRGDNVRDEKGDVLLKNVDKTFIQENHI